MAGGAASNPSAPFELKASETPRSRLKSIALQGFGRVAQEQRDPTTRAGDARRSRPPSPPRPANPGLPLNSERGKTKKVSARPKGGGREGDPTSGLKGFGCPET